MPWDNSFLQQIPAAKVDVWLTRVFQLYDRHVHGILNFVLKAKDTAGNAHYKHHQPGNKPEPAVAKKHYFLEICHALEFVIGAQHNLA
jgi:hypothetical protein